MAAGRPSEYDFSFLKQYKGQYVIYGLYTEKHGIKYIGKSIDVYTRFKNHLYNHESGTNEAKKHWIAKYKSDIRIKIMFITNEEEWEKLESNLIMENRQSLYNVCSGGKNNRTQKPYHLQTTEEHLLAINKALRGVNYFNKSRGKEKRFKLLTKQEIHNISNGIFTR